jgi:subtilisin family serine protease
MRFRTPLLSTLGALALAACSDQPSAPTAAPARIATATTSGTIGINVVLKAAPTSATLAKLGAYGNVGKVLAEINAVTMRADASRLSAIRALPEVAAANPDAERKGAPIDAVSAADFAAGINTWDLDAANVTNLGQGRVVPFDGSGVYIGVLDTGLLDSWRQYFPEERIAEEYAKSFGGGGSEGAEVSEQPNKWEHDQNSHGTHVTSSILGYQLGVNKINGVAPLATVIPVKVLNQSGSGQSSMVAEGIVYIANLKKGPLAGSPVVINMSLGGSVLDAVEKAAVDYAVAAGVIVVASAGNEGTAGMGYPGAYAPVISVGSIGLRSQFAASCGGGSWWNACNVPEPTAGKRATSYAANFYVSDFSSRALAGQDLDVLAPGSWVVGPYQLNSGATSYFYLSGTSMASPHVAGIAALMAQKRPSLTGPQAEAILQSTAIPMGAGSATGVINEEATSWGTNATGHGITTADAALAGTN